MFPMKPLTLTQLRNRDSVRHGWHDHEFQRYLQTGDPLRTFCGRYIPAERYRCSSICDQPLTTCPDCLDALSREARKAAA